MIFQIHLDLQTSGRANNDISKEIMEIVKDLSVSAFRGSQVNINMEDFDGSDVTPFPVFIRRSQIVSTYLIFLQNVLMIYLFYTGMIPKCILKIDVPNQIIRTFN